MDVGKALSFVFEDGEWIKKILLGALITLIPVFGQFALVGYAIAIIRKVMADDPRPLPAWDNLGGHFMDGLMFWVASLVYTIPFLIFICPIALVLVAPIMAGENQDLAAILAGASGLVGLGLGCLASLYGILLSLLMPVLRIRYAETGEIGACLRFGEVFSFLFANIGSIIITMLLMWVINVVVVPVVAGLTLGLLALPASVWLAAFSSHLYGQIGRRAGVSALVA